MCIRDRGRTGRPAAGDFQGAGGALVGLAAGAAVQGEVQGDAAGEGLVRHETQVAEVIVPVIIVAVAEGGIAEIGTGEGGFVLLPVAGIDGA